MINPFEILLDRLTKIELLLDQLEKKNLTTSESSKEKPLTVTGAAEYLNLEPSTIYGLVSKKEIPYSKRHKRLYFLESELSAWLAGGRKKTISELVNDPANYLKRGRKSSTQARN